MVYKEIEIDSTWQQPLGEIRVIQEEADGRELRIYLYDNGSPLDLTGKTVSVYIQKPDNTMIYNSCRVEGNQATVTLTLQMMAVSGLTKLCELQIVDTDNHTLKVTLPPLRIIKSNYDGAIESTDEFSALAEQINAALTATKNANEAAEEARTTAATTAEATATTVINEQKGQPNGIATLDSSGNLVQMPSASDVGAVPTTRTVNGKALSSNISLTAADVGAVSQTVYELTPQNGWKAASAASACHLIVTGRLAAITARLTAPSATIDSSNSLIFNLPSGVVPTKYIDVVMTCGGDISNAAGAQIGTGGSVVAFSGTLPSTGLLAIDAVFLIN